MRKYSIRDGAVALLGLVLFLYSSQSQGLENTAIVQSDYEKGEEFPGGEATSRKREVNALAFSQPSALLTQEQLDLFRVGNQLFLHSWVPASDNDDERDGLGPMFNAASCESCHIRDGRGHPPAGGDDDFLSMLFFLAVPPSDDEQKEVLKKHLDKSVPHPVYGGQIQDFSIQGIEPEANPRVTYEEIEVKLNGGEVALLRKPSYHFDKLTKGPLGDSAQVSPRVANQMIGLGLLEAIPDERLDELSDPEDKDGDGISGRPNRVWDKRNKEVVYGRFGWKAGQPTVLQQSAAALAGDMGLSTSLFPNGHGDCTAKQTACLRAPIGADETTDNLEVSDELLELVVFYARNLAVPPRLNAKDPNVLKGKSLFNSAGCASCHTPKHVTGGDETTPKEARGQTIWPYTDMLLHDMGDGLADGFSKGVASGREWRTAPLWGIGRTKKVNKHTFFLHDGRARNMLEAILWHGGEAEAARQAVVDMTPDERRYLLAFLNDASSLPIAFSRKEQMAEEIIKDHVVPRFESLSAATNELTANLQNVCANDEPLSHAHGAFKKALSAWMGVQHIRFGPSMRDDRFYRLQYWPDKHGSGAKQVRSVLAKPVEEIPSVEKLANGSAALQGFSALERVLYAKPNEEMRERRCKLALAIATNLKKLARDTARDWLSYEPKDKAKTVDLFVRNMMEQLQVMRDLKLKRPLGESIDSARPKRAESWRSLSSYDNLSANFDALAELFAVLRVALDKDEENQNIAKATAELLSYGAQETRKQTVSLSQAVGHAEKRKYAEFLVSQTDGIREWVGEYLAPALGVQVVFNAQDGD